MSTGDEEREAVSAEEALAFLEANGTGEKQGHAFVVWCDGDRIRWSISGKDEAPALAQRLGGHAFLQQWSATYIPLDKETREEE